MEKQLKKFFKKLRLSESTISTILGALVVVVAGILIFNYFKQAGKKESITPEAAKEESIEFETQDGKVVPKNLPTQHKIVSGETLWSIAEKYYGSGYNWVDIASENKLTNPDFVTSDQEITIPKVAVIKPEQEISQAQTTVPDTYTVKQGDCLWSISLATYADGYKWTEIAKANNLVNPDLIEIGQQLKLPK